MKRYFSLVLVFALVIFVNCRAESNDAATLFKAKCAMCHGADGIANTTMAKSLGIRSY